MPIAPSIEILHAIKGIPLIFTCGIGMLDWSSDSGVATGGHEVGSATPDSKNFAKNREKRGEISGKIGEKRRKIGKKRQKSGRSFHFAPSDRQGWLCY